VTIDPDAKRDIRPFHDSLLRVLIESQNSDGGWGYHPAGQSATEATAWALCALQSFEGDSAARESLARGKDWLIRNQLADGSWPVFASQTEGCWVTSLAALALNEFTGASDAVMRGFDWVANSWPRTPNFFQRLRERVSRSANVTRQDNSLSGWPWTAKTSSWVEPTAYALILMNRFPRERLSNLAMKRRAVAEAMLCDRMCPGGGWNSGNPMVYGVAGEALVGPTVWALLALQNSADRSEVRESLRWLEEKIPEICGSVSVAIAQMCLEAYGRNTASLDSQLQSVFEMDQFLGNICVVALAALALDRSRRLFPPAARLDAPQ